ncbi:Hpt domain-containing protein [uncultured Psychrobacter sp.]|uniref:Hpt domain-containing protein n=1 Tax=uncultured Psychrobacter sp. TaxID=259303 RepID=UPI0034597DE1
MKNQPNEMVTLEWLLPLFDQQLSQISDGWQADTDCNNERVEQSYHEISNVLIMVNLPQLATIAARLSVLVDTELNSNQRRIGQFAHQLLQYELTQYAQAGTYHCALVDKTIHELNQILSHTQVANIDVAKKPVAAPIAEKARPIEVAIPNSLSLTTLSLGPLKPAQYRQLLLVWRQQVKQLLSANSNQPTPLAMLEKVSHYLWQTTHTYPINYNDAQPRLWYLTALWLDNLASNVAPLPASYAALLGQLDDALNHNYHYALNVSNQPVTHTYVSNNSSLSDKDIEELIAEIYVQISSLAVVNEQTQDMLDDFSQMTESNLRFLPRILAKLESIIFGLEQPQTIVKPLYQLKKELERRGWVNYKAEVEQILTDLESSINSEPELVQIQGQIECQLQELYIAIQDTEYSIDDKIGKAASFAAPANAVANDDDLRQLRIAFEDVKYNFNNYVQHQQISLLPTAETFVEIGDAFDDMGLSAIRHVSDKLGELFAELASHNIERIDWQLTQALAESITAIELLLDYLAQQVFDQHLLQRADARVEKAYKLVAMSLATPDAITNDTPAMPVASNVVRYDDHGEIAADHSVPESTSVEDNSNKTEVVCTDKAMILDSEELRVARAQTKPDDFEMDEEIREIFIEEAVEVLADLTNTLPLWQQDAQNLSPLAEMRRGFHTLKGSGRMVGAFSVSEAAWAIENLLNRVLDKTVAVTEQTVALVAQTIERLSVLVADFTALQMPSINPAITILQSNNLLTGQPLSFGMNISEVPNSVSSTDSIETPSADNTQDNASGSADNSDNASSGELSTSAEVLNVPAVLEPFMLQASQLPVDDQDSDPDIKEIFIEEAEEVLADILPKYEQWRALPTDLSALKEIRRGFHTLKGSGRMVGAYHTAELAWSIEDMLNRILDHSITVSEDIIQLLADVLAAYPDLINTFANNESCEQNYPVVISLWVACAQAYSKQYGDQFSYSSLREHWFSEDKPQAAHPNSSDHTADQNKMDSMLETMHSINEKMAGTSIVTTLQTEEEQAFYDIFVEEAQALLQDINDFVSTHHGNTHTEVTDEIVRAFHTLRAASGTSTLSAISEVSATIEHSLEQLQKHDTPMNAQHLQALAQSVTLIEKYLRAYEQNQEQQSLPAEDTQDQQNLASLQAMLKASDDTSGLIDNKISIAHLLESGIDTLLNAELEINAALDSSSDEQVQEYVQQQIKQISQLAANTKESPKFSLVLNALSEAYHHVARHPDAARDTQLQAALLAGHQQLISLFDALAGSMSLKVNQQVLNDLQTIVVSNPESNSNDLTDTNAFADYEDTDNSDDDNANHSETKIAASRPTTTVQSEQADKLHLEVIDTDIELLEIFLEEAQELDSDIVQSFGKWRRDTTNKSTLKVLQRHLHTIKGGARMAGIRSIGDLTHEAESIYEAFVEERLQPTAQWLTIMQMVQDTLSLQIDYVVRYQETFFAYELIEQLQQFERSEQLPEAITLTLPALQDYKQDDSDDEDYSYAKPKQESDTASLDKIIAQSWSGSLPDPDILEVFLEEAEEIVESSNQYLQLFLSNVSDISALQALQRDLHTIKGGARMVGANGIADLAHEMETVYEELAIRRRPATKMVAELLTVCHDWLADAVFILKEQANPLTPVALIAALQQFSKNPDNLKQIPNESLQDQRTMILAAKAKQQTGHVVENLDEMPSMSGSFAEQEQSASSNEMIRISGGVIEHMINLSGESAINRARIDMGMSSLTNSIEEMGTTVQRLADQLRRMEIELEAQILSQIDDAELIDNEDFDPLEMDQYSSLNQLSKSLSESASDLIDINDTLLEKTRDSENLLLQLSRTQTELQDGLMNSRMVPFTHLTPRLERIVRQTANELNKSVELNIINADNEIDRTILERITSPLEHMLRNAVDHGIENTQTRLSAGKDRSGHITLEVLREGSEIVINLVDDGRGIDVNAVREKAIAQGLIEANDESLTDLDIMQYIFNAGLSTTQKVTQISGRGVGMDVVISEIRQLGGVVSVTSKEGQGSRFTIRVPLTVAISDALVVRAADRYYAIPLVQIERVIRINPEKLYDYYQSGAPTLSIEDDNYRIRYLNEILTGSKLNELMVSTNTSLPLIIIKNRSGQKLALQVDQIAGSRIEVVVKPLGRQLSHLAGISAATIMGDGSVMLILDLIALMRNAPIKEAIPSVHLERSDDETPITILVVDDSVTVRKVTSRLLERQGINVAIAKDGIDAIEILQETVPDLMLLDIEMPRMDGFEVATQVRHNKRLRHIPIIMITSRTGEKHRERALEIGVNDYMGKPFQENELLGKIQTLLGKKLILSHDG